MIALMLLMASVSLQAQLLYKISGKGLTQPSYIVGTYHLAPASFVDSIPGIRQAMDSCQQVYGELPMDKMANPDSLAMMQRAMMLPDGMTLDKLLTADEMARLNVYMKSVMGMDMTNPLVAQQMNSMTPMALSTTLTMMSFACQGEKCGRLRDNVPPDKSALRRKVARPTERDTHVSGGQCRLHGKDGRRHLQCLLRLGPRSHQ